MNTSKDRVFRVRVIPGGVPLKYREKGGGVYSEYRHAFAQYERLENRGSHVVLEESVLDWKPVNTYAEAP